MSLHHALNLGIYCGCCRSSCLLVVKNSSDNEGCSVGAHFKCGICIWRFRSVLLVVSWHTGL